MTDYGTPVRIEPDAKYLLEQMADAEDRTLQAQVSRIIREAYERWQKAQAAS